MAKLGPYDLNTIVVGDCLQVMAQMPDSCVDLVVTDPPYNTGKDYGPQANDRRDPAEFLAWYFDLASELYRVHGGGYLYVSCNCPQIWDLRPLWERAGWHFEMMLIWHGPNYACSSNVIKGPWALLYEPIFMLRKGPRLPMLNEVRGINSDAVQRWPRPQSNYQGDQHRMHPTQKPVQLYKALIGRTPGNLVFDPFIGSGTSAKAAKYVGRDFFGCDINPHYVRQALRSIDGAHQNEAQLGLFS